MNNDVPIINAMFNTYQDITDAYLYGPICVAVEECGKGLAQAMFLELRRMMLGREGIIFIRRDNTASLHAHAKMGIREVASFVFDGNELAVLSYIV